MPLSAAAVKTFLIAHLIFWAPFFAALGVLLGLIALLHITFLHRRIRRLSPGASGLLEETLQKLLKDNADHKEFRAELEKYLKLAEARLRQSVQGVGVVRFNPFAEGQGGNQSFCVAFLDEQGSGVVFSTLYARDRVGVYAKPLAQGVSSFELTDEEKESIAKAQEHITRARKK